MLEGQQIVTELEAEFVFPNGTTLCAEVSAAPFPYKGRTAIIYIIRDVTERKTIETHKRDFYRRTILAATQGKLVICDREEIEEIRGMPLLSYDIRRGEDAATVRHMVADTVQNTEMDESRIDGFILCAGESVTNAIKHAGGGPASLIRTEDGLLFVISDKGPGIKADNIPEVALRKGYTTAVSLGMGYKVMIAIADRVYLATGPEGTTVGIEMKLHAMETCLLDIWPDKWQ